MSGVNTGIGEGSSMTSTTYCKTQPTIRTEYGKKKDTKTNTNSKTLDGTDVSVKTALELQKQYGR